MFLVFEHDSKHQVQALQEYSSMTSYPKQIAVIAHKCRGDYANTDMTEEELVLDSIVKKIAHLHRTRNESMPCASRSTMLLSCRSNISAMLFGIVITRLLPDLRTLISLPMYHNNTVVYLNVYTKTLKKDMPSSADNKKISKDYILLDISEVMSKTMLSF